MTSKIRTQARDAVIAAEQWAATVEMERDVAREEAAELREQIARMQVALDGGTYLTPNPTWPLVQTEPVMLLDVRLGTDTVRP